MSVTQQSMERFASSVAALIGDGSSVIREYLDNKDKVLQGTVNVMDMLCDKLGEEMDNLPVPGSGGKNDPGNNNPDKYPVTHMTKNGVRTKYDSFYTLLFRDTPIGAGLYKQKAECDEIAKASKVDLVNDRKSKQIDTWISNGRAALIKSVRLYQKLAQCDDLLNSEVCSVQIIREDEEGNMTDDRSAQVTKSPTQVQLIDKKNFANSKVVTIGQFLAYNIPAAAAAGGTVVALMATAKKTGTPTGLRFTKFEEFDTHQAAALNYSKDVDGDARSLASFTNKLENNEIALITFFQLADWYDEVCKTPRLAAKYAEVMRKKDNAVQAKANAAEATAATRRQAAN